MKFEGIILKTRKKPRSSLVRLAGKLAGGPVAGQLEFSSKYAPRRVPEKSGHALRGAQGPIYQALELFNPLINLL